MDRPYSIEIALRPPSKVRRRLAPACAALVLLTGILATFATRLAAAPIPCNRVAASRSGSDSAPGTAARPFWSVQKLVNSLRPGQTGCLRAGTYGGSSDQLTFSKPGITITSYPGDRATIAGYPLITGAGTTLSYLNVDLDNMGDPTPHCGSADVAYSLEIETSNVTLSHDNIYQSNVSPSLRSVAVGIGWSRVANHAVIRNSRIHDFGSCRDLDHGIYVSDSSGTQIYGDSFWNGPHGWAVQLYPSAHHSHVYRNVVDHVGSGFAIGGEGSDPSSYNRIDHNVVKNSTGLPAAGLPRGVAMSAYWGGPIGPDNIFDDNVSINNPGGMRSGWGVAASGNKTVR